MTRPHDMEESHIEEFVDTKDLIVGAYYTYTPDPNRVSREGFAVVRQSGRGIVISDTLWQWDTDGTYVGGDSPLTKTEKKTLKFLFNPHDSSWFSVDSVDSYNEDDFVLVTSRGGRVKKYWVKGEAIGNGDDLRVEYLAQRLDESRQLLDDALIGFHHAYREYYAHISTMVDDKMEDIENTPPFQNESE